MTTTPAERELLIAQATTAHRTTDADGHVQLHPAWLDLDADGRRAVHERTLELRTLEAAASPTGHTSTARAVLARLRAVAR